MPKKIKTITCIYCKQSKASSKEHAVQRSLGGNLTIPVVCQACNNGFSKIDQALAERSLLSMIRIVEQTTDAETLDLAGTHFWTPPGEETLEVQIGFRMNAKPKPQLMFQTEEDKIKIRSCVESASDYTLFIQVIRDWIATGKIDSIPVLSPPVDEPNYTLPRLVLHKSKDLFFRPPKNFSEPQKFFNGVINFLKNDVDKLDDGLKKSLPSAPIRSEETPQIVITASIKLNDVYRAIAKIGFNILAEKEGADFVLRTEFDPIRSYIRGIDIQDHQPNNADEVAYDPRFVRMIAAGNEPPFPRAAQGTHTCLLMYSYPMVYAGIDFYGQQYYMVQLGEVALDRHIMHVHSFNYVDKTNKTLTILDIAEQIQSQLKEPSEI